MPRIALASLFILVSLLGLLFGVGLLVLSRSGLPANILLPAAAAFSLSVVLLQYAIGPKLIDSVMAIRWTTPAEIGPGFAAWMTAACATHRIAVPQFGIIEDQGPNAFTYGNGAWNARVVVTRGVVTMLDEEELRAVVAHELGHIRNRDFIFMTLVQAIVLSMYSLYRLSRASLRKESLAIIPVSYIAYQVSYYLSLLISRLREYMADHASAQIQQNANPLASALVKIAYGMADTTGTAFQASYTPRQTAARPQTERSGSRPPQAQIILPGPSASLYDYSAPLPDINRATAKGDVPADVMAKIQAMQTKANQEEIAPLMGILGMRPSPALAPAAGAAVPATGKAGGKLPPSMLGAFGVCGVAGAISAVGWMKPGGGIDAANFARAARWELYNPWAKIAELISTHPLTARRIVALMKLNARWNVPSEFDFKQVQPGKYSRFLLDIFLVAAPYLAAAAAFCVARLPRLGLSGFSAFGAALMALSMGWALVHLAMYPAGFLRAKVLGLLSELQVSHINPKPVVVEGVFTGYMDAGSPWAHHFVLQDETGFIPTRYYQPFGMEYIMGMFRTGRSLGRPVRVEGWFRRFGSPMLEISSFEYLDTRDKHHSHYPIFRFGLFVLSFLFGLGVFVLGRGGV